MDETKKQTEDAFYNPFGTPRAEDESFQATKPELTLEDVAPLDRPMTSSPDDVWTGMKDELGNKIYTTKLGQTYSLQSSPREAPKSRIKAAGRAIGEYLSDPTLPSKEQVLEGGKAVAKALYEPVEKGLTGEGTYGDVLGVVPAMGAASLPAKVPEGALRAFGGVPETPKFKEWFGQSKARTGEEPNVYYTGTSKDKDFKSFNVGRHGAWFTRNPEEASMYALENDSMGFKQDGWKYTKTNTASRVIPAYLKAENPYTGDIPEEYFKGDYKKSQSEWFDTLRKEGYDAWMPESNKDLLVVLKEPQQIKSIFNSGEFSPKKKDMNFNQGGLAMDEQMNKLFAEGGINTGQVEKDPISGNEVPPGSMPEEVRDDIPAKLSGGEYVVPADVLRFYGVSFFEKLRKKAKEGLSAMDSEGRIGGDVEEEDDDDFPFDPEELEAEDELEMAEGGVVPATPGSKPPAFNPGTYGFGGQQFTPPNSTANAGGTEVRNYINATGERRSVLFVGGQPAAPVPEGFVPDTEEGRKALSTQSTGEKVPDTKSMDAGEGRDTATTPEGSSRGRGTKGLNAEDPLQGAKDALDKTFGEKAVSSLAGLVGGPLGMGIAQAITQGASISKAIANRDYAIEMGMKDKAKEIQDLLDKNPISRFMSKMEREDLEPTMGQPGFEGLASARAPKGMDFDPATGGYTRSGSAAPTTSPSPRSRPGGNLGATGSTSKTSASPSGGSSAGGSRGGDDRSTGGFGVDARAKGGLMVKKKPTATKKKIKVVDK